MLREAKSTQESSKDKKTECKCRNVKKVSAQQHVLDQRFSLSSRGDNERRQRSKNLHWYDSDNF